VHDGNLASRAAEADEAQLEPKAKGLPKTHRSWWFSLSRIHVWEG